MMAIYYHDVQQGSAEWDELRLGVVTASQAHRILTPAKLAPSASAEEYLNELLAEYILGRRKDFTANFHMERGIALEPTAVAWLSVELDADIESCGFIARDETGMIGASPDGLIGEDGGAELKNPAARTQIGYLRAGELPREYRLQVQMSLWVSGRDYWAFCSWHPDIKPLLIRVEPDPEVFAALDEAIPAFVEKLMEARAKLRERGIVPLSERDPEAEYPF